jgi:hypothetical protein
MAREVFVVVAKTSIEEKWGKPRENCGFSVGFLMYKDGVMKQDDA